MAVAESKERPKLQVSYPEPFDPLFPRPGESRYRYYVFYGGRDSAKSWSVAQAIICWCMMLPVRVLCTREVQNTIAESVHQLLEDTINRMEVRHLFDVQKNTIICKTTGATIIYHGLHDLTVANIKSFEGINIAWVEEGHSATKCSLGVLENTIRADDSEIWITFNPELDTDHVYDSFVTHRPKDAFVRKVTFEDNPWRSQVLEETRRRMQERDPQEYDNIYGGNPRVVLPGAIYAREVTQMVQDRRVRMLPYDPRLLVHTIWDLGWNDQTSIIFAQRQLSEVRIIDYEEESFLRYDEWARRIKDRPYHYGDHWLPHDAENATQGGGGLSAQKQLKPLLGKMPKIVKRPASVEHPIREVRMMFPRVYMDEEKCSRLLECLKRFRRGIPESTGEPGAPIKDEYRHGADAFGYLAMIVDKLTNEGDRPVPKLASYQPLDRGMGM